MKNSHRVLSRLLSLLLVIVMLTGTVASGAFAVFAETPSAAGSETGGEGTPAFEYVRLTYDAESKTFSLLVNANWLTPLLEKGTSLTMEDLRAFVPDGLVDAVRARDFGRALSILGVDVGDVLTWEALGSLLDVELLYEYIDLDVLLRIMTYDDLLALLGDEGMDAILGTLTKEDVAGLLTDEMLEKLLDECPDIIESVLADTDKLEALLDDDVLSAVVTLDIVKAVFDGRNPIEDLALTNEEIVTLIGYEKALEFQTRMATGGTVTTDEFFEAVIGATSEEKVARFLSVRSAIQVRDAVGVNALMSAVSAAYPKRSELVAKVGGVQAVVAKISLSDLLSPAATADVLRLIPTRQLMELVDPAVIMENISLTDLLKEVSAAELKNELFPVLLNFVLEQVSSVTMNGTEIYSGQKIHTRSLMDALLENIPSLADFAAADPAKDEKLLTYRLSIAYENSTRKTVTLQAGFAGDTRTLHDFAGRVSRRADYDYQAGGKVSLSLRGGASLSAMYANFLRSTDADVTDELKLRVIRLFSSEGEALRQIFEQTTAEEVLILLRHAPAASLEARLYRWCMNHENAVEKINALKERVLNSRLYGQYADSIVSLYDRIVRGVLADFATEEDEEFALNETSTVDPVAFLARHSSAFAKLSGYFDETEISLTFDIQAELHGFYQLKFVKDGDTVYSAILPAGADVTLVLSQPQFEALGREWTENGTDLITEMPAHNTVIHSARTSNVVFHLPDGTTESFEYVVNADKSEYLSRIPAIPEREHYTIDGWYYENEAGERCDWSDMELDGKQYDYYPAYRANVYTITYIVIDPADPTIRMTLGIRTYSADNTTVTPPALPAFYGYTGAWEEIDFTTIPGDVTVESVYTLRTLTRRYLDKNTGREILPSETYTVKDVGFEMPAVPEKEGYTGIWLNAEMTEDGVIYYAQYTEIPTPPSPSDNDYTVTFPDGTEVKYENGIPQTPPPAVPAKRGYTGKWTYTAGADGKLTAKAEYTAVEYKAAITMPGSTTPIDLPFTVEDDLAAAVRAYLATQTPKAGYYFDFTITENGATGASVQPTAAGEYAGDVTVTVREVPIEYRVDFYADGVKVGSTTYTVENKTITAPAVPAKLGYTGVWETYTLTTGDVEVRAVYTPIVYTATFVADGKTVAVIPFTVESKDAAMNLAVPEKAGFTGKWETYTLAAGDITIHAVYTAIPDYQPDKPEPAEDSDRGLRILLVVLCILILILIVLLIVCIVLYGRYGKNGRNNPTPPKKLTEKEALNTLVGEEPTPEEEPIVEEVPAEEEPAVEEEPVVEETPAEEEPVAEEEPIVEETPAEEPAVEEEPAVIAPVAEEPVAEEEPVVEETPAEEPVAEEEPIVEETPAEEPVAEEEPVVEEVPVEEPVAEEEPIVEETPAEEPVAEEEPVVEEVPVEEPVAEEEPIVEETPAEEPVAEEEPVVEEVPAEEPAPEETPVEEPPVVFVPKTIVVPEGERSSAVASALRSVQHGKQDEADDMTTLLVTPDGQHVLIKYRKSFRARMIQSCDESKEYYSAIKNYILSFDGVAASDSWNYESFAYGRKQLVKMNITGKTLVLFLALDPAKLEGSKYKYDAVGDRKRYEKTPVKIKVRSARAYKWAVELVDMVMEEAGHAYLGDQNKSYVDPYEEKEPLIERDLIKVDAKYVESGKALTEEEIVNLIANGAHVEGEEPAAAPVAEAPVEEPIVEEPPVEEPIVEEPAVEETPVEEPIVEEPAVEEAPVEEPVVEEPAVEETPVEEPVAEEPAVEETPVEEPVVEEPTVEETPVEEPVAEEPAVEEVPAEEPAVEEPVVEEVPVIPVVEEVTAEAAPAMVETSVAKEHVEHHSGKRSGKQAIVNLDTLSETFAAGETVTLEALQEKHLIPRTARRYKVLARGKLTHPLIVEADDFSVDAVKMILLTGGKAVQIG